jgi:CRP/FNR family transcriptional regulator, cyclic AMP receptor protein
LKQTSLEPLLRCHPFFGGLAAEHFSALVGCAANITFPGGAFLFCEGDPAAAFYLIRSGRVALEISAPGRGPLTVQTLGEGDVTGFSWLLEPHQWEFDGRAVERVLAIQMDGECLRRKCEQDPRLGYELMRRFSGLAVARLQATRLQLLDVYGHAHDR